MLMLELTLLLEATGNVRKERKAVALIEKALPWCTTNKPNLYAEYPKFAIAGYCIVHYTFGLTL